VTAPTSYGYQWKSAGTNATGPGATTPTYTVVAADQGNDLTCVVTGMNSADPTGVSVTTAATSAVQASTSTRFIGYTMDLTNRGGMVGKQLTTADAITPRTNFPGGATAASNQSLPCYFESFTDYLAAFPWPPMIGCFMNTDDEYIPSGGAENYAPLYFGTGASTTTEVGGYPTYEGQLTDPAGLTGSPFIGAPYKNVNGSDAIPAIPIISWDLGSTSLAGIAAGSYDTSTIIPAALACKNWPASNPGNPAYGSQPGGQVIIRFCHEMNGTWSGYCPGFTGQPSTTTCATFRAMWQHVVEVFAEQGATNVRWHWCPNVFGSSAGTNAQSGWSTGSGTVALLYPGDAYVDYVGLDGYNYTNNSPNWQTFLQVFQNSYKGIYTGDQYTDGPISAKPMILGEIGCWETDEMDNVPSGQSKEQWFKDIITVVPASMPNILGLCYWYENPGAAGNQTSTEYYLTSSTGSVAGWTSLAETWSGRPPVIEGVTAVLA
jgi:Glycosyl hydrolase family 26